MSGRKGRSSAGVLSGLSVRVAPAPQAGRGPVPAGPPRVARPARRSPGPGGTPQITPYTDLSQRLSAMAVWVMLVGAGSVVAAIVLGLLQGVRLLLLPHPDAATTATAVAMVLGATVLAPAIVWVSYRRMQPPRPRTSPWQGGALEPDPATQAELLASPAGAIARAMAGLGCFVVLVVVAVLAAPLAWVGAVPALGLTVLLGRRMLRPTVLVVNRHGFGVRTRRWDDSLAVPWSDVAEVTRDGWDTVLVIPTPNPDGSPAPRIQLRGAGPAGADQVAALLQSYLDVRRSTAPPPGGP